MSHLHSSVALAREKEFPINELAAAKLLRSTALLNLEAEEQHSYIDQLIQQRICEEVIAANIVIDAVLGGIGSDEERNITGDEMTPREIADVADARLANNSYLISVLESAYDNGDITVAPSEMLVNISDDIRERGYRIASSLRSIKL